MKNLLYRLMVLHLSPALCSLLELQGPLVVYMSQPERLSDFHRHNGWYPLRKVGTAWGHCYHIGILWAKAKDADKVLTPQPVTHNRNEIIQNIKSEKLP